MDPVATSVFLFDGDCAFCSSCARFLERYIPHRAKVSAWQFVDIKTLGLTVEDVRRRRAVGRRGRSPRQRPRGDRVVASRHTWMGWALWRPAGWVLSFPPFMWIARPVYRWVARNRDKMPGGTPACALPHAQRTALGGPTSSRARPQGLGRELGGQSPFAQLLHPVNRAHPFQRKEAGHGRPGAARTRW